RLNATLPRGLQVQRIERSAKLPQKMIVDYQATLPAAITPSQRQEIADFLAAKNVILHKIRKKKSREIDIRPLITEIKIESHNILLLQMRSETTLPGAKPIEVLEAVLKLGGEESQQIRILKKGWHAL
ncbi:MAG: hypothetical protein CSB32_01935, partial [Desulfobacterales bacterium]